MRRFPLANTLTEIASIATVARSDNVMLYPREMSIDLPIEISWERARADIILLGQAPRWRWQTAFDAPLGRLSMTWCEQESP
jgi:hypothetical protein